MDLKSDRHEFKPCSCIGPQTQECCTWLQFLWALCLGLTLTPVLQLEETQTESYLRRLWIPNRPSQQVWHTQGIVGDDWGLRKGRVQPAQGPGWLCYSKGRLGRWIMKLRENGQSNFMSVESGTFLNGACICTSMFVTVWLSTIAKRQKQQKYLLTDEWVNKMWSIHTMKYYSALKRKEILTHDTILLCQVKQARHKRTILSDSTDVRYLEYSNS